MIVALLGLLACLAVILVACELFTNAVEWLGKRLNLGVAAVGSVLAAVGTAMPETLVPLVAFVLVGGAEANEIGVGAILGAPFMLATLAFFVSGVAALGYAAAGRRPGGNMNVHAEILARDLRYFFIVFAVAVAAAFIPSRPVKLVLAAGLLAAYGFYVYQHLTHEAELEGEMGPLLFDRRRQAPRWAPLIAQLVLSLAGIMLGAKFFVGFLTTLAHAWGVPALVLSMVLTPIATELPEKFNSVSWIRQGKDTLALGNISGAMVFQSSILPAIGMVMTPWAFTGTAWLGVGLTLGSAGLLAGELFWKKTLSPRMLLVCGAFYLVFVGRVILAAR